MSIDVKKLIPRSALGSGDEIVGGILSEPPNVGDATTAINSMKSIGSVFLGVSIVTCILFLAIYITKLGAAGDDENARKKATSGILVSGIALAILGGLSIFLAFFWGIFRF